MGVVEAMQHLQSLRKNSSRDTSHSEERLGQLPMEDGECFFHARSLKLERQIVSSVRDFPPGCGRNVQLKYWRPAKEAISMGTLESVPTESLVSGCRNGDGHGVEKLMLSSGQVDETDLINSQDVGNVETIKSLTALEHELSDFPNNLHQLNDLRPVDEEEASVGTAEYLNSRDGKQIEKLMVSTDQVDETVLMTCTSAGTVEAAESLTALQNEESHLLNPYQLGVGVATPKEEMAAVLSTRKLCFPPYEFISVFNGHGLEKNAATEYPFRRRIVSAVRDFPPLCGRNVYLKAHNFGQVMSGMGDEPSPNSVKQTKDVQEGEFHKSKLGGNVSEVTGDNVQPQCKEQAVQQMERQDERKIKVKVVWKDPRKNCIKESPRENYHSKLHEEDFESSELPSKQVIVLGLMAAPNCPFRKVKKACKGIQDGDMSASKPKKKPRMV